ncbi:MAG: hypothetical protein ACRESX_08855, partial [Gammaproteobacteria bacterium]
DLTVWVVVLLIQSIPYCASLLMALISASHFLNAKIIGRAGNMDSMVQTVLQTEILDTRN